MTEQILIILSWFFGLIITAMIANAIFFLVERIMRRIKK